MSDVWQGPGWWLASDGKWYSPESRPGGAILSRSVTDTSAAPSTSPGPSPQAPATRADAFYSGEFVVGSPQRPSRWTRRALLPLSIGAAVVVLVGAVLGVVLGTGSKTSLSADSPTQIVALVTSAVQRAGSVHVVTTLPEVHGAAPIYDNDTGRTSGKQTITYANAEVQVVVVAGKAYINANSAGLSIFQAQPAAQKYAGKWLAFSSGGQVYDAAAQTVTLSSLLQQVLPTGSISKLAPTRVNGRSVVGLVGALPGGFRGTLYVSTSGSPLPVQETLNTPTGRTTVTFSDWGEPVNVTAPTGAIPGDPVSSLFGPSNTANDRAAQANLTNALTEAKALYQNSQSYSTGKTPMTPANFSSNAPEFAWTTQGCGETSPNNCVSIQVVDAAQTGDGQGIVFAVYNAGSGNCWYGIDLESPASAFVDTSPNVAVMTSGRSPTGLSSPGVFFAEKAAGKTSTSASTYCSAAWAATQSSFDWGPSYSNAGNAA